ncbi:PQQ-dependent sugar dehydrogenase [Rhodobacteraceae bacterium 2CG4]|uniref:PQQ-dependent sugar dehydrogenase n=1 Tax=Halovulum marinum TaxID=2662447 RepID=A0A6L5YZC0_9RHOB|nr:PQQ-dependent sugar dehydrogenase [Halovulum marinum]MSU89641.1 PQQ-dependent sugar dehydrogenase [Halovulum marinum]
MPAITRAALLLSVSLLTAGAACAQTGAPVRQGAKNAPHFEPAFQNQTRAPARDSGIALAVETLAEGLANPWGIAALPDGGYLVTERAGRLRVLGADGSLSEPVRGLPEIAVRDQGGLLDVALGPAFDSDRRIYWTYAKPKDGGYVTAAARGVLSEDRSELTQVEDIFVQEPVSPVAMHFGARILFDGEGRAFVTTGEHSARSERGKAQDLGTTFGKVIRINPDGSVPQDNPYTGEADAIDTIWSLGHRNIQGADIHPESGALWTVEHGPRGGDELNIARAGENYGWPVVSYGINYNGSPVGSGEPRAEGMVEPRYYWDPVIAPGGMVFYDGDMFADWQGDLLISSLNPGALVRLRLDGDTVTGEERLLTDQGRIRDLEIAADGAILALVDAANGKVLRLTPEAATTE